MHHEQRRWWSDGVTNGLGYIHPHNGKLLYFHGRADDAVIRTGGERVASVLASGRGRVILDYFATQRDKNLTIVECAVFPPPDEKFGEALCAAVVVDAGFMPLSSSLSSASGEGRADVIAPTSILTSATSLTRMLAPKPIIVQNDVDIR